MGFPESVLTADERVVSHLHPHWKALIRPILIFVVAVAVVVVASVFLPVAGWAKPTLLAVGAVAVVLALWLTVWPWLGWRNTPHAPSTERVIMRHGVFSRAGRDIPLGRVNDVSFSHTLLERMLGCGTLTIESAGERGQVVLDDIPRVEKTQSVLYELVDNDRQKHTFGDDDREALVKEIKND